MLFEKTLTLFLEKGGRIILILVAGEAGKKLVSLFVKKIKIPSESVSRKTVDKARMKTLTNLVVNTGKVVINFIIFMTILSELGMNIAPLITGAGILGLAVGFGAKSLVADIIAGFFILLENQFNVGDEVEIAGHLGEVKKISLRTITLKDKKNRIYIVPNSRITTVVKLPL